MHNHSFTFILWDIAPQVLSFLDIGGIRWYGLLFASGFLLGQIIISHIYKTENQPASDVDAITFYMVAATVIGARLGHCLFYEPEYYLAHPLEILMVWQGGLASHGATIGILLGIFLYSRSRTSRGQSYLWTLDRIVIVVALGGSLIRLGNLMNSEIVGKPTALPWAMVYAYPTENLILNRYAEFMDEVRFEPTGKTQALNGIEMPVFNLILTANKAAKDTSNSGHFIEYAMLDDLSKFSQFTENFALTKQANFSKTNVVGEYSAQVIGITRHPAQLYEAITTFLLFVLLFYLWDRQKSQVPEGSLFGLFVLICFGLRFCYEFLKENQVAFEEGMSLNMGQWLSLPLIPLGLGIYLWAISKGSKKKMPQ